MNGLKYWDPEESTRTKWETTYASELQDRGLSQDFTGLSTLLLGQAQPAQFQTEGQTGYWWGSKVSDDGSWTELDAVTGNTNSEIPRSYDDGNQNIYGNLYNYYGATAESKTLDTIGTAPDSICPHGWQLPSNNDVSHSWINLLQTSYGFSEASQNDIMKLPMMFVFSGYLNHQSGNFANRVGFSSGTGGHYYSSEIISSGILYHRFYRNSLRFSSVQSINGASNGFSVRCVKK